RVSGRVENEQKEGVAGAKIQWTTTSYRNSTGPSAVSDSDGNFTLQVGPFDSGLLEVKATGYGFYRSENDITVNREDVKDIIITLQPEARVEGRVVNSRKEGVAGASVTTSD